MSNDLILVTYVLAYLLSTAFSECGVYNAMPLDVCMAKSNSSSVSISCNLNDGKEEYIFNTFNDDACSGDVIETETSTECGIEPCICASNDDCNYAKWRVYSDTEQCSGDYEEFAIVTDMCFTLNVRYNASTNETYAIGSSYSCSDNNIFWSFYVDDKCPGGNNSSTTPLNISQCDDNIQCIIGSDTTSKSPISTIALQSTENDDDGDDSDPHESDNKSGVIIGSVIGIILAIGVIALCVYIVIENRKTKELENPDRIKTVSKRHERASYENVGGDTDNEE